MALERSRYRAVRGVPSIGKIDPLGETEIPGSTREGLGLGMTNHEPTNSTQRKKRGVFFVFSDVNSLQP